MKVFEAERLTLRKHSLGGYCILYFAPYLPSFPKYAYPCIQYWGKIRVYIWMYRKLHPVRRIIRNRYALQLIIPR